MAVEGGLGIFHDRQSTVPARVPLQLKGGEIFFPNPFPPNEAASVFHWKAFAVEGNKLRSAEKRGVGRSGVACPGADLANTPYPRTRCFLIAIAIVHGLLYPKQPLSPPKLPNTRAGINTFCSWHSLIRSPGSLTIGGF
jgi:hypothetical protein